MELFEEIRRDRATGETINGLAKKYGPHRRNRTRSDKSSAAEIDLAQQRGEVRILFGESFQSILHRITAAKVRSFALS